jgi:hypothetical protein
LHSLHSCQLQQHSASTGYHNCRHTTTSLLCKVPQVSSAADANDDKSTAAQQIIQTTTTSWELRARNKITWNNLSSSNFLCFRNWSIVKRDTCLHDLSFAWLMMI